MIYIRTVYFEKSDKENNEERDSWEIIYADLKRTRRISIKYRSRKLS